MHVLVSNDDGVDAPGLHCLAERLRERARVTVVAPDRDRSGASNSLTLDMPIRAEQVGEATLKVSGTPTDCVHLAFTGLLADEPDMVVSGINSNANLGDDVIYSGTVAAAMEGRFLGLPAIAVSLAGGGGERRYETAAEAVMRLLGRLREDPLPTDTILNVNVPNLPWDVVEGFRVTRLGHRHRAEQISRIEDPRGRPLYWIGPPGAEQDAGEGTDFHALNAGYISVTPIHADLTRFKALDTVAGWVDAMGDIPG